jgi:DnaK suppressor protein
LGQVRLALQRLKNGGYGRCLRCDQRIGSRRLKAVPWASMCVTCQGHVEAEQQNTVPSARLEDAVYTDGGAPRLRK